MKKHITFLFLVSFLSLLFAGNVTAKKNRKQIQLIVANHVEVTDSANQLQQENGIHIYPYVESKGLQNNHLTIQDNIATARGNGEISTKRLSKYKVKVGVKICFDKKREQKELAYLDDTRCSPRLNGPKRHGKCNIYTLSIPLSEYAYSLNSSHVLVSKDFEADSGSRFIFCGQTQVRTF